MGFNLTNLAYFGFNIIFIVKTMFYFIYIYGNHDIFCDVFSGLF